VPRQAGPARGAEAVGASRSGAEAAAGRGRRPSPDSSLPASGAGGGMAGSGSTWVWGGVRVDDSEKGRPADGGRKGEVGRAW